MGSILLTLGVVVVAIVCFIKEWFPLDITALMVMVLLMVLKLVTPEEGISGFSNSATITVMSMFILSAGVARTGAVDVISRWLVRRGGRKTSQQILVLGAVVGPISAFINNTAVVAVFLPVVEDWCRQRDISPSKLLMPLSFMTVLGGTLTLLGTSTNVVASGLSEQLGYEPFGLFQFTALGLVTATPGLLYLAFVAPRWLPDRKSASNSELLGNYGLKDYISEVVISPDSPLIGQTIQTSLIQRQFDLDVLELIRGEVCFPQPLGDRSLEAHDVLLVRGNRDCLIRIKAERGLAILPDVQFNRESLNQRLTTEEEGIAEVMILSNSGILGSTLKSVRFRQRYNATVLAIQRGDSIVRERLGKVSLRFGDILLLQGPKQNLLGFQSNQGFVVTAQQDLESFRRDKAGIAIAIVVGVIVLATLEWLPILTSAWVGVLLMLFTGCLRPGELYTAVRWDIIFLLAGLIPLGIAMESSGASQFLADYLVKWGGGLPPYLLLTALFLFTSLVTEILSNNACVVLILPIAVKMAESLQLNPYAFMFLVTFAASNSFMTPVGYQTNTMVYGPGGYRFSDFLRVGTPLNLMMAVITPPMVILIYGL